MQNEMLQDSNMIFLLIFLSEEDHLVNHLQSSGMQDAVLVSSLDPVKKTSEPLDEN